ncbi:hypothetical protein V8B97DRAFT_1915042 [Scleroderma yunnanense]
MLSPSHIQQLKRTAWKMTEDDGVPLEKLNQFIDIFLDDETEASAIKCFINSKDFYEFIQQHVDVFKVTKVMLEDSEVYGVFAKTVSRALMIIQGQIKNAAAVILIFMLHIGITLHSYIDIEVEKHQLNGTQADEKPDQGVPINGVDKDQDNQDMSDKDVEDFQDKDFATERGSDEDKEDLEDPTEDMKNKSPITFNTKDYWKFMDTYLDAVQRHACWKSLNKDEYQTIYTSSFVQYLQADLYDYPSHKKLLKLLKSNLKGIIALPNTSSIPWQNTIHQELI